MRLVALDVESWGPYRGVQALDFEHFSGVTGSFSLKVE